MPQKVVHEQREVVEGYGSLHEVQSPENIRKVHHKYMLPYLLQSTLENVLHLKTIFERIGKDVENTASMHQRLCPGNHLPRRAIRSWKVQTTSLKAFKQYHQNGIRKEIY